MAALYSREFYALARSRLTPKGYISQWLPVSQVPKRTTLAMIRAFVEVFPQAVLVSGVYQAIHDWRSDKKIDIRRNQFILKDFESIFEKALAKYKEDPGEEAQPSA